MQTENSEHETFKTAGAKKEHDKEAVFGPLQLALGSFPFIRMKTLVLAGSLYYDES
ncbi:hypothetical protein [Acetobacter sp. DsW_059]|uniref:hypothetical protein n=1 Tax=Acetobacter sp. DsW_059 TaxID=1670661 RepID=UPI001302BB3E|nr:hypothetical protein [Acetobacter sp. DsW_059]